LQLALILPGRAEQPDVEGVAFVVIKVAAQQVFGCFNRTDIEEQLAKP